VLNMKNRIHPNDLKKLVQQMELFLPA